MAALSMAALSIAALSTAALSMAALSTAALSLVAWWRAGMCPHHHRRFCRLPRTLVRPQRGGSRHMVCQGRGFDVQTPPLPPCNLEGVARGMADRGAQRRLSRRSEAARKEEAILSKMRPLLASPTLPHSRLFLSNMRCHDATTLRHLHPDRHRAQHCTSRGPSSLLSRRPRDQFRCVGPHGGSRGLGRNS